MVKTSEIIPAATVLLVRDDPVEGLEVFMVVRHHQIDFASGALVFPGGKVARGDTDPALADYCDGAVGLTEEERAFRVAAVRETFEECGILLARAKGSDALVGPDVAEAYDSWRGPLDKGERDIIELLKEANLRLALDTMVPFARWVTPDMMPKRFDTMFYVAAVPENQLAGHDGREAVESTWIAPDRAVREAADGKWTIIFPTRLNVEKLAKSETVAEALERAHGEEVKTVTPELVRTETGNILRIRDDAGYDTTDEVLERAVKGVKGEK